jgi:dihydroanticapsin dehydrogenase
LPECWPPICRSDRGIRRPALGPALRGQHARYLLRREIRDPASEARRRRCDRQYGFAGRQARCSGVAAYCASKGAVVAFGNALALELAKDRIRVNTICPGWIDTPFNDAAIAHMGGRERQAEFVRQVVPLGRQGTPSEIAPLYVYLASDESSYMTGQALVVDGGIYN